MEIVLKRLHGKNSRGLPEAHGRSQAGAGQEQDELVFLGLGNVAGYSWCAELSVLKSRKYELGLFASFLSDIWNYSLELGYTREEEKRDLEELIVKGRLSPERLLELRDRISSEDLQKLLLSMKGFSLAENPLP